MIQIARVCANFAFLNLSAAIATGLAVELDFANRVTAVAFVGHELASDWRNLSAMAISRQTQRPVSL